MQRPLGPVRLSARTHSSLQPLALLVRSLLVTGEACLTGSPLRKARNVEPLLLRTKKARLSVEPSLG